MDEPLEKRRVSHHTLMKRLEVARESLLASRRITAQLRDELKRREAKIADWAAKYERVASFLRDVKDKI